MVYISSIKLLLKFEDTSLEESINTEYMEVEGYSEASVLSNGYGYYMRQDQYLFLPSIDLDIDNTFSIGFWLYSTNSGVVENPGNGEVESIEMPVLDLRYDGLLSFLTIKEISRENGKNYIKVEFNRQAYITYSNDYTVNLWHYIWIIYNGWERVFEVYVDGTLHSSSPSTIGTIDTEVNRNLTDLYINKTFEPPRFNMMNNRGYIGNIIIFDETMRERDMQRLITKGPDSFEESESVNYEKNYGVFFEDPSTLQINSSIDDMSYIYIASNDGRVLRGSPLFWESRRNYSNSKEMEFLREDVVGESGDPATNVDGFLRVNNSVIRL